VSLEEAISESQKRRDLFNQDVHVLRDNEQGYFTVLDMNLKVMLENSYLKEKKIYYTAWILKKMSDIQPDKLILIKPRITE